MKRKEKILELRSQGKTYNEIAKILNCSKSIISYHCGEGQKEKNLLRSRKSKRKHPFVNKTHTFIEVQKKYANCKNPKSTTFKLIKAKIYSFFDFRRKGKNMKEKPSFTYQDVINKFGE